MIIVLLMVQLMMFQHDIVHIDYLTVQDIGMMIDHVCTLCYHPLLLSCITLRKSNQLE